MFDIASVCPLRLLLQCRDLQPRAANLQRSAAIRRSLRRSGDRWAAARMGFLGEDFSRQAAGVENSPAPRYDPCCT